MVYFPAKKCDRVERCNHNEASTSRVAELRKSQKEMRKSHAKHMIWGRIRVQRRHRSRNDWDLLLHIGNHSEDLPLDWRVSSADPNQLDISKLGD
jgi:hypothetical protein